jgi:hypothetical protein
MAELTITLRCRSDSNRVDIRVGFVSDEDMLPHEHEVQHRQLISELFPTLEIVDDSEANIRVRRERLAREPVVG